MCCFSRPVKHVSGTSIFARMLDGGRQALIYSMNFEADEDLAMVLPLPVVPGAGEDAVEFVSLQGYDTFFVDLARAFPTLYVQPLGRSRAARSPSPETLKVHDVGDFEASYVPRLGDFDRLDPRFRIDDAVWAALPTYADYGFAVFKLKRTTRPFWPLGRGGRKTVHPMAFTFPSRAPERLFFPTLHIHDGAVEPLAGFDHSLYAQRADEPGPTRPQRSDAAGLGVAVWHAASGPLQRFVDIARTGGLVDPSTDCWRLTVQGMHDNGDVWVDP